MMPRLLNVVFPIVVLTACGHDAVAPPRLTIGDTPDSMAAASTAPVTVLTLAGSRNPRTAGLDDALSRLVPTLGSVGETLRGPLTLLRDDLAASNSKARDALLAAAEHALDGAEKSGDAAQQADLDAIRLTLIAIRVDDARDTSR